MRVIVADDDANLRRGLCAQVVADGFDPIACENGVTAFEALTAPTPVLMALLDWNMPGLSGLETIRRLRERDLLIQPYVVMLSVRSDAECVAEGLQAGADYYLTKPFSMTQLQAVLEVGQRSVRHQLRLAAGAKDDGALAEPAIDATSLTIDDLAEEPVG